MMNIEQITSKLAQMPDQALQQYAMMHKEDPYIMALAVSESRRRKQMRAAAAPQAQAQPKVVDQALMEMAPEAGLAALPAGDMNFAGGGIVAFADGGDVEHYQVGGSTYETPYDRMNRLTREQEERDRQERLARIEAEGGSTTPYSEQMRNVGGFFDQFVPDPRELFKTLVSAPGYGLSKDRPAAAADTGDETKRLTARYGAPTPGAARSGTTPAGTGGLGATPEARQMMAPAGAPSVQGAQDLAGQFLDTQSLRGDLRKYQEEERAAVDELRKRREEGKPEGKAYSKFEEMLQREEAGAAKEKDEATGVAIFKAGLAMMAGSSPYAFSNIGKGAMVGLEEYSGAMKDMKKAAKERQKAMADIENARRAEERDDWKAKQDFETKANDRLSKAREFGVKGIMDITGKDAEISAGIYKTQVEQQGALQRTQIQAAAMRDRSGGGDKQTLAELKALQASINEQLKSPRMMGPAGDPLRAQLQQINAAIAQMAGLGTMMGAPGAPSPGGTMSGWGKASVINP